MNKLSVIKLTLVTLIFILVSHSTCAASSVNSTELGIILIPSSTISADSYRMNQKFNKNLKTVNIENIPHISLFQGRFPDKNKTLLEESVTDIARRTLPFKIEMEENLKDTKENIFWMVKPNPQIVALHKQILAALPRYTDGLLMQQVIDIPSNSLTSEQTLKIKKYGIFWVDENFFPHITIFYNSNDNTAVSTLLTHIKPAKVASQFVVSKIAIARLGYAGNVVEILREFDLGAH